MTTSFPETKTGPRFGLASAAVAGCLAMVLLAGLPVRAEDANPVLAKVNGAEIRQSDMALAEEELGPSLAQMDPATKKENVLAFLIDMKIVAKAAEAKKIEDRDDFKARLAFARNRLLMDNLLAVEGKAATTDEAMKKVYEEAAKQIIRRTGSSCPAYPGRDRGRGQGDRGGAQEGRRFRRTRQEEIQGSRRVRWRRSRLLHQGPDGAGILRRRLRAGARQDFRSGEVAVRLAHHQGRGKAQPQGARLRRRSRPRSRPM